MASKHKLKHQIKSHYYIDTNQEPLLMLALPWNLHMHTADYKEIV